MLDDHGEEIYTDLMLHYRFNLADALAGITACSSSLVLAMIRNLPEGSRYVAIMSAPDDSDEPQEEKPPLDPAVEAVLDRMTWTEDRRLLAQILNQLNVLIRVSGTWKDGKGPEFPIIGPAEWREEKTSTRGPKTISDLMNEMGHIGRH